jgi:molybdopterin biosynthesis enzyme
LVKADQNPHEGQLIEFNSLILSAQIEEAGGIASVMDIIPDEPDSLMDALQTATDHNPT